MSGEDAATQRVWWGHSIQDDDGETFRAEATALSCAVVHTAQASMDEARSILHRVVGSLPVRIFLFGSRALGTSRAASDIDLALLAEGPIPPDLIARLRDEFEESTIPYSVDILDLSQVTGAFREKVLREGREWVV